MLYGHDYYNAMLLLLFHTILIQIPKKNKKILGGLKIAQVTGDHIFLLYYNKMEYLKRFRLNIVYIFCICICIM